MRKDKAKWICCIHCTELEKEPGQKKRKIKKKGR